MALADPEPARTVKSKWPKFWQSLLPPLWQERPAVNPERNDATLARVSDTDSVYRAFMDHAYQHLDNATAAALQAIPPPGLSRDFLAGRASSLAELISSIESVRTRAKEIAIEEQRRRANPARH